MVFWEDYVSDEVAGIVGPVAVYWLYGGLYHALDFLPLQKQVNAHRLHSEKDLQKNKVDFPGVVRGVLFQQALQMAVAYVLLMLDPMSQSSQKIPTVKTQCLQFAVAMLVLDTWQYFMHRAMHESRFLYRHLHSWHHQLYVPYALGALYNHPIEGLLMDTCGGALAFVVSGMHPRTAVFFFCFATMKTVDDHCGLFLPFNPFQWTFQNNSAYHDIHHQLHGFKYNFSQPFFPIWDHLLGTYMPHQLTKRAEGGLEAKPMRPAARVAVDVD